MNIIKTFPAKSISYGGKRSASAIKFLVYHYTGNPTDSAVANAQFFNSGNKRAAGAHYFVSGDTVYQSIDDSLTAYAVGGGRQSSAGGSMFGRITNANSISIEMCSTRSAITKQTMQTAAALGKKLMKKYNIDINHVYRHWDVNGKACPGWSGWTGSRAPHWRELKAMIADNGKYPGKALEKVNVRSRPDKTSRVVKTMEAGERFEIIGETPKWYKIDGGYVAKSRCAYRVKTTDELNIRNTPTAKGKIIDKLDKGAHTWIKSEENTWGLRVNGGYIKLSYTSKD